jgi:hypothetical protein
MVVARDSRTVRVRDRHRADGRDQSDVAAEADAIEQDGQHPVPPGVGTADRQGSPRS